jgi:hypothetical protein
VHPYKKGGIRRLTCNEEAEETYKEEEMMQKEEVRIDADATGGINASAELQSPSNSFNVNDSSVTSQGLGEGTTTKKRNASPVVPDAQVDVSDAESELNGSVTSGETAALVKRCQKKRKTRNRGKVWKKRWTYANTL